MHLTVEDFEFRFNLQPCLIVFCLRLILDCFHQISYSLLSDCFIFLYLWIPCTLISHSFNHQQHIKGLTREIWPSRIGILPKVLVSIVNFISVCLFLLLHLSVDPL
jgi:hypothetical protein